MGGRFRNEGGRAPPPAGARPGRAPRSAGRRGRREKDASTDVAEYVPLTAGTRDAGAWRLLPALGAAAATAWFAGFVPAVARGEVPVFVVPWVPALGIDFAFRLDGLALAFALLICGIGAMVFLYAATYFQQRPAARLAAPDARRLRGLDARARHRRRRDHPLRVLGGDDDHLLAARRLRPRAGLGAGGGAAGAARHRARRARAPRRAPADGRDGRDLPAVGDERDGRDVPREPALPRRLLAGHPRLLHQVGAVPVPVLAAERDGGADAGLGLPALGDDGEGRGLPARAPHPGARRHRALDLGAGAGRRVHHAPRLGLGDAADRPEADARLHHGDGAEPDGDAARRRHAGGDRGGDGVPLDPRLLQGRALPRRRDDREGRRARATTRRWPGSQAPCR